MDFDDKPWWCFWDMQSGLVGGIIAGILLWLASELFIYLVEAFL